MNTHLSIISLATAFFSCVSCSSNPDKTDLVPDTGIPTASGLKVATWNMEHFAAESAQGCRLRSSAEYAALKLYAETVNADVFAIQEVASVKALRAVFPEPQWNIHFSSRADSKSYECRENGRTSTQQKVAVITRKSLSVTETEQFAALGLNENGLRYGVEVDVAIANGALSILAVHLKSGCFVEDYRQKDSRSCNLLARQIPELKRWIKQHEQAGLPYLILGDFNHRLAEAGNVFASEIKASVTAQSQLTLATENSVGCHPWYPAPIDHIWAGGFNTAGIQQQISVWPYENMAPDAMLSDHCAVSVSLPLTGS